MSTDQEYREYLASQIARINAAYDRIQERIDRHEDPEWFEDKLFLQLEELNRQAIQLQNTIDALDDNPVHQVLASVIVIE